MKNYIGKRILFLLSKSIYEGLGFMWLDENGLNTKNLPQLSASDFVCMMMWNY